MAEANREEAERACRRAQEHFLAGNVAAARRLAGKAQRLYPPLPGVANAVAAYAIHAAAPDWHAVLGVDRHASTDAVKKQFRRLSLLVHPDKNHCAAAEGAFKLLGEACDALSSGAAHGPYVTDAASAQEWFRSHHSTPPPPPRKKNKPQPPSPPQKKNKPKPPPPPPQKKNKPQPPPPPPQPPKFRCPGCERQFTSMVSTGPWRLRCKNCLKGATIVHVKGPDAATCT